MEPNEHGRGRRPTRFRARIIAGLLLVACWGAVAAWGAPGSPDAARGDVGERLDEYLRAFADAVPAPGLSAVVVKGERILLAKGYGVEVAGSSRPMTARTASAVGSLTKSFTAMCIMQLAERGKLRLDDPVVRHLPWFRTMDPEESAGITIRMLLSHTSGIPPMNRYLTIDEELPDALQRGVRALASVSLLWTPGTGYQYCNEGYDVAGAVIEAVSGTRYQDYLEANVLDVLGMRRSTSRRERFAEIGALYGHNTGIRADRPTSPAWVPAGLASGQELRSTAEDLGAYLVALLNGGARAGRAVIGAESIRLMWTPAVSFEDESPELEEDERRLSYGLGWFISRADGRTLVYHSGGTITMSSYAALAPDSAVGAAVLLNVGGLDEYRYPRLETVVNNLLHIACGEPLSDYRVPRGPDPTLNSYELPPDRRAAYLGSYESRSGDTSVRISAQPDGELIAEVRTIEGVRECLLDFVSPSTVVLRTFAGSSLAFFRSAQDGRVTGIGYGGRSLAKVPPDRYEGWRWVSPVANGPRFAIPSGWEVAGVDTGSSDARVFLIRGGSADRQGALRALVASAGAANQEAMLARVLEGMVVVREGQENVETVAGRLWREQAYLVERDGFRREVVTASTRSAGATFMLALEAPLGDGASAIRTLLAPIMRSLSWNAAR